MSEKEELLKYARTSEDEGRVIHLNLMGCDESWYEPYYAIKHTFSVEELEQMSDDEIRDLIRLAGTIGEALY